MSVDEREEGDVEKKEWRREGFPFGDGDLWRGFGETCLGTETRREGSH
jgi:hypothetical protein